jgi:hypothetical protein
MIDFTPTFDSGCAERLQDEADLANLRVLWQLGYARQITRKDWLDLTVPPRSFDLTWLMLILCADVFGYSSPGRLV